MRKRINEDRSGTQSGRCPHWHPYHLKGLISGANQEIRNVVRAQTGDTATQKLPGKWH